jgi:hypothetical protein
MKDVYKQKVGDIIASAEQRVKIVHQMITGERPADPQLADQYLRDLQRALETIQEVIDIS